MKRLRLLLLPGLLLTAFFCRAAELNAVLATVNDEAITLLDVMRETGPAEANLAKVYQGRAAFEAIQNLRKQTVERLIDRKLVLADFQANPFPLPEQAVETMLDRVAEDSGARSRSELEKRLLESGMTIAELRKRARETMIQHAMYSRREQIFGTPTPREIYDLYLSRRAELETPETLRLSALVAAPGEPPPTPANFAERARASGKGPVPAQGGDLGMLRRDQLRPEFAAALAAPVAGRVYGPVKTPEGTYFLWITAYTPKRTPAFREVADDLRKQREAELREKIRRDYHAKLRADAAIALFF